MDQLQITQSRPFVTSVRDSCTETWNAARGDSESFVIDERICPNARHFCTTTTQQVGGP